MIQLRIIKSQFVTFRLTYGQKVMGSEKFHNLEPICIYEKMKFGTLRMPKVTYHIINPIWLAVK